MKPFWLIVASMLLLPTAGWAAGDHAIAMNGEPRYPANFTHFDYANPDAPKGGTLRLAKGGSFDNLNSLIIMGTAAEGLEYLNDRLMQRAWNEPFTLYGMVAESVDVSDDRSKITFHLNKAARFHDGTPMTTADVKFTFDAMRTHGHPVRRRVYGLVSDVAIVDDHTITFTFGPGYDRESVMILAMMPVLPRHYWQTRDVSKTTLEPPLGSGPYKVVSVDPGRRIVYERVPDYWAKDLPVNRGLHNFDTVVYSYYRDDDIALQSFKAGEYDVRTETNIQKWNTSYDSRSIKEGRVLKEEVAHARPEWLRAFIFNTRRPAFADVRVREALSLMFNFDWVNKNLFYGEVSRIDSTFPNAELAARGVAEGAELDLLRTYKDSLPATVFGDMWQPPAGDMRDRQRRAMALLKEAGWVYKDQKLIDPATGAPFSFELLLGSPAEEKIALEFARSLARIGVTARVRTVDSSQFAGRLDGFDYDMVSFRWINSLSPGNEQSNYWGRAAAQNRGSRNYAGVDNPAIDALADSIARAEDRDGLVARTRALDRALMWGYYFIPLQYLGRDLVAHDRRIVWPETIPVYGIAKETWWYDQDR